MFNHLTNHQIEMAYPQKLRCLIHWVNEHRWDVWPAAKVPGELRFQGAIGLIKYTDGQSYLGQIVKISANKNEIEEAEEKLHLQIQKKKETVPVKRSHAKSHPAGKVATSKEVSKAIGERPKLSTPEKEAKKKASDAMKAKAAAQKQVEEQEDRRLFKSTVSRNLFVPKSSASTSLKAVHNLISDDDEVSGSDNDNQDDIEEVIDENVNKNVAVLESKEDNYGNDCLSNDESDGHESDPQIHEFRNPNTEAFLQFLLQRFRRKGSKVSNTCISPPNKVYAKPLECSGQKMVHLKKGHSLRISKGARNILVLDKKSQKSASNFVRKTLTQLYGAEQLMEMTVMGRKKDSISISQDDLNAIYEFVSEYTDGSMSWGEFTKVVMKKCAASKASPKQPKSKSKTPDNNFEVVASPAKFKANVVVETLEPTKPIMPSPKKVTDHPEVTDAPTGQINIQGMTQNGYWNGAPWNGTKQWDGNWQQQSNDHHQFNHQQPYNHQQLYNHQQPYNHQQLYNHQQQYDGPWYGSHGHYQGGNSSPARPGGVPWQNYAPGAHPQEQQILELK